MESYLEYRGYRGTIERSTEFGYEGHVEGLENRFISYWGDTVEELKEDFESSIDIYIEACLGE